MEENKKLNEKRILSEDIGIRDEVEFDAKLEAMMQTDTSGKKGKKSKKKKHNVFAGVKRWSKKRKILTASGIVAVFFLASVFFMGGNKQPQIMVMTTPVLRQDIVESLSLSGPISGTDSVDIVSNLHAEVLDIQVKEGDKVEKGQLLATIDRANIQKEADIAQNSYELAVNTQKEQQILAENGYAKAQQEYQNAVANVERTTVLFQGGGVSQLDLEAAQNQLNEASRNLKIFNLVNGRPMANESYVLQVKNAEFELEKKRTALENTEVKSPIAGTVIRVNAKVGRFADKIEGEKPMFIIENLDVLEMKIPVSEYSIGKIKVGQTASISADILSGDFVTGTVAAISPTGEEKGSGSAERVIPTTIQINEGNSKLIAGITAKASILINESKNALVVPISSLFMREDGTYIATVENSTIKLVKVDSGVESDIAVEIIPADESSQLENAQVVTNPNMGMTDGMRVSVMPGA